MPAIIFPFLGPKFKPAYYRYTRILWYLWYSSWQLVLQVSNVETLIISVVMVPGFCNSVGGDSFLICHRSGSGEYDCAVGRQPSKVSEHCQHCMPLAQCARDLGLYTTINCDKITHRPPVVVSLSPVNSGHQCSVH